MNDLSSLPILKTASELIAFLKNDPKNLVVCYGNDLSPDEFQDGYATRTDIDSIFVRSLKEDDDKKEAIVAYENNENDRKFPFEIMQLLGEAEEGKPNTLLRSTNYEDIWILNSETE